MFRTSRRSQPPTSPTRYPPASFIKTEKGYFYIVSETKRYRILSERVLASWRPHRVIKTTEAAVSERYRIAAKLKFRNGSLIWNLADGKMYLIEEGKRRWVKTPDLLTLIGAKSSEALVVSQDEINLHEEGADLT